LVRCSFEDACDQPIRARRRYEAEVQSGAMRYVTRKPGPPLRGIVDYLWALSDAPGHTRERIVPSGTLEMVVGLGWFRGGVVSGCYDRAFDIDTRAHDLILGIHFKPGVPARVLGVPAGELANAHVALDDLWGASATELHERLCAAPNFQQRFELLEQALIARLPDGLDRRPAVSAGLAELEQPGVAVGHVADLCGLSRRRFIEVFTEDVGMTPKRYSMVRRLQRALTLALRSPSEAWVQIALDCGYFDQAHLCRDWAELTGLPPGALRALRGIPVKENHVALPEAAVKSVQDTSAPR
jgi:AraC-like DNA-binding protein